MRISPVYAIGMRCLLILAGFFLLTPVFAQSNVNIRIMAANLNGNTQSYQPFALRILQGTKPDVVCIQEFNYTSTNGLGVNTDAAFREMLDTAFGTNYVYFREPFTANGDIPNGIISRYPIIASGSWADTEQTQPNRGFAWAQIDIPGTNDLYVVSVHLLTSTSTHRANESIALKALMQANFPANAWAVVAGDFNAGSRSETCVTTYNGYLTDFPVPVDNLGNSDTSGGRNAPHDYVLPSLTLTNFETATVFPSHSFPTGLVFDSAVYTPLTDASPVQSGDSGQAQHMAVMKDFLIPAGVGLVTNPPSITSQPLSQTNVAASNVTFTVTATGTAPLAYQWRFGGTNLPNATTNVYTITNIQATNAGNYVVVVTNIAGSVTSSVAVLAVITAPVITANPAPLTITQGGTANFSVTAVGLQPLSYQWRVNGTNISGATTNPFSFVNAQLTNAGNYVVVVTNTAGSITSSIAALTVTFAATGSVVTLAGWDFNGLSAYGPSPMAATTNAPIVTVGGLTRGNGVTTANQAAGRTWGGDGFSSTSAAAAITAGKYATFSITANTNYTVSFSAISQLDYKRTGAGPPNGVLQYQVGTGAFTDITTLSYSSTTGASLAPITLSSIAALQNVASTNTVTFRFVNYGGTTGNWYLFDLGVSTVPDLVVQGIINNVAQVVPATAAVLNQPAISGNQFGFSVSGAVGANYVVQTSTNLTSPNWLPVFTNVAPFNFTDPNPPGIQKYYRVVGQ